MTSEVIPVSTPPATVPQKLSGALEALIVKGDLAKLNEQQRVQYYGQLCEAVGLDPRTRPFDYLQVRSPGGGQRTILYALKSCTDQLRTQRGLSVKVLAREEIGGVYRVVAEITDTSTGRTDQDVGAVWIGEGEKKYKGDDLANAFMKAETKAKRRATLSFCGLGLLDESETDTIRGATTRKPDSATEAQVLGYKPKNLISDEQLAELKELLIRQGAKPSAYLARYGVPDLSQMTVSDLADAKKLLALKEEKGG